MISPFSCNGLLPYNGVRAGRLPCLHDIVERGTGIRQIVKEKTGNVPSVPGFPRPPFSPDPRALPIFSEFTCVECTACRPSKPATGWRSLSCGACEEIHLSAWPARQNFNGPKRSRSRAVGGYNGSQLPCSSKKSCRKDTFIPRLRRL